MDNQSNGMVKSIYRRGADDGFWFGIYLSVLCVALFKSIDSPVLFLAAMVMVAAVPVIVYFFLRRGYRVDNCKRQFSAMWLHGICIFFFGSLLMALTAYIYLRFIEPAYINNSINMAKELYLAVDTAEAREIANLLQKIQDNNLQPTAGGTAMQIIWFGVLTGSLLSMVLSSIIRAVTRPAPPKPPQMQQ